MIRITSVRGWPAIFLCAAAAGCGPDKGSLSGDVTYEGVPVEKGAITLYPADGNGPIVGAPIQNGRYQVNDIPPGPKLVKIEAVKAVPFARSSEEMAKMYEAAKAKGDATGIIDRADIIPDNAEGNNQKIDVKKGSQTQHFHLKKPPG